MLCDLVPGGIGREISAGKAARIRGQVTPSGPAAAARCELAAEFLADLRRLDAQLREASKKLAAAVRASGTSLTGLFGVGPVIAGTVIGDVRQVFRFPDRDHFASWNGTAPDEVSSGDRKKGLPAVAARQPAGQITRSTWPRPARSGTSTATAAPTTTRKWPRARRTRRRCAPSSAGSATPSAPHW